MDFQALGLLCRFLMPDRLVASLRSMAYYFGDNRIFLFGCFWEQAILAVVPEWGWAYKAAGGGPWDSVAER